MKSNATAPLRIAAARRLLAGALLALSAALPAQAAIVVGTFDPAFGPFIPNLGFRGTVSVNVPDACFAQPAGFILNADACSGNAMTMLSAHVELYNTTTPGNPTLQNLAFSFGAASINGVVTGFSGVTGQNELLGVDTVFSTLLLNSLFDPGLSPLAFDDVFFDGSLELRLFAVAPAAQVPGNEPFYAAELYACQGADEGNTAAECALSLPAPIVFATRGKPLPEPGTLPLLAISALALLGSRRRLLRA